MLGIRLAETSQEGTLIVRFHKPSSEYAHGGYHVMSIKTVDACWAILDALSAICNGKPHTEKWLQNLISL